MGKAGLRRAIRKCEWVCGGSATGYVFSLGHALFILTPGNIKLMLSTCTVLYSHFQYVYHNVNHSVSWYVRHLFSWTKTHLLYHILTFRTHCNQHYTGTLC